MQTVEHTERRRRFLPCLKAGVSAPETDEEVVAGVATMMIFDGRPRLPLLKGGVVASVVALILFLGSSYFLYCFFFCGSGIPLTGEYRESSGLWQGSGVRYLAPGFWLALGGYLLSLIADLTPLIGVRRSLRQLESAS
jgi:hypothetical protein